MQQTLVRQPQNSQRNAGRRRWRNAWSDDGGGGGGDDDDDGALTWLLLICCGRSRSGGIPLGGTGGRCGCDGGSAGGVGRGQGRCEHSRSPPQLP